MKNQKKLANLPLFGVAAFALLGVALMLWPDGIISAFPVVIGLVLILVGALGVAHWVVMRGRLAAPGMRLLQGVLNIVVGIIFLVKRDVTMTFLSLLFGGYILVMGGIEFSDFIQALRKKTQWVTPLVSSLSKLVLGLLLLFAPFSGRTLWVRVLGLYFVVAAVAMLVWMLRHVQPPQEPHKPDNTED